MNFIVKGRLGSRVCDWGSYALLRDNIQHFVEGGRPSGRFRALHDVARALDRGSGFVDAVRLRLEVFHARVALWSVRFEAAALSSRTRAIHFGNLARLAESETVQVAGRVGLLPVSSGADTPVPRAASNFVNAILALTVDATAGELLEIERVERWRHAN